MRKLEFLFLVAIGCSLLAMSYCIGAIYEACFTGYEFIYFNSSVISIIAISITLVMAIFVQPNNSAQKAAKKRFSILVFLIWLTNLAGLVLVIFSASSMKVSFVGYTFPKLLSLSQPFFIVMYIFLTFFNALFFGLSVKYNCDENIKTE